MRDRNAKCARCNHVYLIHTTDRESCMEPPYCNCSGFLGLSEVWKLKGGYTFD